MDFLTWLRGRGLSDGTVSKYYTAIIGVISEWAIDNNLIHTNIINIYNNVEFRNIKESIFALPIFIERNTVGHNMYSCALDKYEEYLRTR
jgi:hypothetical protein